MNRIAAVIVTYNRLPLLIRCIESIRNQRNQACDIIVINNGSTDGTYEWLKTQSDIKVLHQENLGGAGGFYIGMKTAVESGYEWLWLMDDDGVADSAQLDNLVAVAESRKIYVANALVVDIDNNNLLSFGFQYLGRFYSRVEQLNEFDIIPKINPFNGTLIHRRVIEQIGYIKKEMFIWGDEQEYTLRMINNNVKFATITKAIHYHPRNKGVKTHVFPFINKWEVIIKPENLSHIYYRNLGYIYKEYYGRQSFLKVAIKYCVYFLTRLKFHEAHKFIRYYVKGAKNIFE